MLNAINSENQGTKGNILMFVCSGKFYLNTNIVNKHGFIRFL